MKTNLIKILVIFIIITSLVGCTFPDPSKSSDTLLIGRVLLEAKDVSDTYTGSSVNGKQNSGVHITFLNNDSGKKYTVITGKMGFFYIQNFEPGKYIITELRFEANSSTGAWSKIWTKYSFHLPEFTAEPGQVINLGSYLWNFYKSGSQYYAKLTKNGSPEELKSLFEQNFPKSLWLQHEWINIL